MYILWRIHGTQISKDDSRNRGEKPRSKEMTTYIMVGLFFIAVGCVILEIARRDHGKPPQGSGGSAAGAGTH
jgi:hypothetical protein